MMPLLIGRDVSFYGSPLSKGLILLLSTTTLVSSLIQLAHPLPNSTWILCLHLCTFPTARTWTMGVVLMYWTRSLERQLGPVKFMRVLCTSYVTSMCLYSSLCLSSLSSHLSSHSSVIVFMLIGMLVTQFVLTVKGNCLCRFHNFQISSHFLTILLLSAILASVPGSVSALFCGTVGAMITHFLKPLPFPTSFLSWIVSLTKRFVAEKPPRVLSGATIDVQRQQNMDLLEGFVMNLHQRRQGLQVGGFVPRDDQVQQLTLMGFRWEEARQALISSQGEIHHAIQLLTTNTR